MVAAHTGHVVISTQTEYVLVRLTGSLQLEMSKVYQIHNSPTQLDDAVMLVLFSTLAAVNKMTIYPSATAVRRVIIPQFPTWLFQPYQGVFNHGARRHQTNFCKPRKSFLPLCWLGLEGEVQSADNDVTVAYGQLLLFFFAASVVVKTAHSTAAAQRLDREFLAYSVLRAWQGVAIPRVFGMYTGTDQTKVLLMSDAGQTLREFSDLEPADK